ncbi:MAG: hypothetical protein ACRD2O_17850 [Terriglobia bacterium]
MKARDVGTRYYGWLLIVMAAGFGWGAWLSLRAPMHGSSAILEIFMIIALIEALLIAKEARHPFERWAWLVAACAMGLGAAAGLPELQALLAAGKTARAIAFTSAASASGLFALAAIGRFQHPRAGT